MIGWSVLSNRHVVWTSRCMCLLTYVCTYVEWASPVDSMQEIRMYVCMCVCTVTGVASMYRLNFT